MTDLEIINELEETIKCECHNNPLDYEQYIDECLLFDPDSIADYYDRDVNQISYLCKRALMRLT